MLNKFEDYRFVTSAEKAGCPISGYIRPLMDDYVCRGEDVLFLTEAFREIKDGFFVGNVLDLSQQNPTLANTITLTPYGLSGDLTPKPWIHKKQLVDKTGNQFCRAMSTGYEFLRGRESWFDYGKMHFGGKWSGNNITTGFQTDISRDFDFRGVWDASPYQKVMGALLKAAPNKWTRKAYTEAEDTTMWNWKFDALWPLSADKMWSGDQQEVSKLQPNGAGVFDFLQDIDMCAVQTYTPMTEVHGWQYYKRDDQVNPPYEERVDRGVFRNRYDQNTWYNYANTVDDRTGLIQIYEYYTTGTSYNLGADVCVWNREYQGQVDMPCRLVPAYLVQLYLVTKYENSREYTYYDAFVAPAQFYRRYNGNKEVWSFNSLPTPTDAAPQLMNAHNFSKGDNKRFRIDANSSFLLCKCNWRFKWWQ